LSRVLRGAYWPGRGRNFELTAIRADTPYPVSSVKPMPSSTLPLQLRPQAQCYKPNSFLTAMDVQQQFYSLLIGFSLLPGGVCYSTLAIGVVEVVYTRPTKLRDIFALAPPMFEIVWVSEGLLHFPCSVLLRSRHALSYARLTSGRSQACITSVRWPLFVRIVADIIPSTGRRCGPPSPSTPLWSAHRVSRGGCRSSPFQLSFCAYDVPCYS
jgi:hypothetical protein